MLNVGVLTRFRQFLNIQYCAERKSFSNRKCFGKILFGNKTQIVYKNIDFFEDAIYYLRTSEGKKEIYNYKFYEKKR